MSRNELKKILHTNLPHSFLSICLSQGNHIQNSPMRVLAEPGPSITAMCVVTGGGLYRAVCGALAHFSMDTRDGFGNRAQPAEENIKVTLSVRPALSAPTNIQPTSSQTALPRPRTCLWGNLRNSCTSGACVVKSGCV